MKHYLSITYHDKIENKTLFCERFEPRSHFKSKLSLIIPVNVVLNSTVVVDSDWRFDHLCGSHLPSQSELYHVSWWCYTLYSWCIRQVSNLWGNLFTRNIPYVVGSLPFSDSVLDLRLLVCVHLKCWLRFMSGTMGKTILDFIHNHIALHLMYGAYYTAKMHHYTF